MCVCVCVCVCVYLYMQCYTDKQRIWDRVGSEGTGQDRKQARSKHAGSKHEAHKHVSASTECKHEAQAQEQ